MILATHNAHKVREFARLLDGFAVRPLPDGAPVPEETGTTFAENALIKARAAFALTGEPAIADDSGIGAEVLDWGPGVFSARFAGEAATDEANLAKLEAEVPAGSSLRYTCVIAYVDEEREQLFEGTCQGAMASRRSGNRGFGYDPVFALPDGRTMADLSDGEKDAISHRGRAARELREWLSAPPEPTPHPMRRLGPTTPKAGSAQIDRRRRTHGEQHPGVAEIAVDEQHRSRDQADADGDEPGEAAEVHGHIVTHQDDARPRA